MKHIIEFQDYRNNKEYMYTYLIYTREKKREKKPHNFFRYSQFTVNNS